VDTYWYEVIYDGWLTIRAPIRTPYKRVYNMVLKMSSEADALDTRTHEFSFKVTITEDCSRLFNYPETNFFAYTI
jgi:hypothetical protein